MSDIDSLAWRKNFILTLLERDLPQLGIKIPAASLYRFWNLLAHYHGQVWNAAEAARAGGQRVYRATISRPAGRRLHGAPTGTLVRESG